jgi:RNA polymerase sigma-70 factor (ECF subfamily)
MALGELLMRYLDPLRAHLVLNRRIAPDKAEDLLQSFISDRILEQNLIAAAVPERGRFRTFLLITLDRFVSNNLRDEKRLCRSPGEVTPGEEVASAVARDPPPSSAFEIAWAREVLLQAAERMRDECLGAGRTDLWQIFETRVLAPTLRGAEPVAYEDLAARFSLPSAHAASNLLTTGKRMFARSLRGVVGEYIDDEAQIEEEITDLRAILARPR